MMGSTERKASVRLMKLLADNPGVEAIVKSNLSMSDEAFAGMLLAPSTMTMDVICEISDNCWVDTDFIVFGSTKPDYEALTTACMSALGDAALSIDPVVLGITCTGDPSRFIAREGQEAWKLAIGRHLASVIGTYYADHLRSVYETSKPAPRSAS